jgi:hypothetical protein
MEETKRIEEQRYVFGLNFVQSCLVDSHRADRIMPDRFCCQLYFNFKYNVHFLRRMEMERQQKEAAERLDKARYVSWYVKGGLFQW